MARFYGWNPDVIEGMSLIDFNTYLTAMSAVSGSEKMTDLGIADYPHMKKDSRNKFFKQIDKQVKPLKKKKDLSEIGAF